MAFNVNQFIAHFDSHAGFSKSSKFDVLINVPSVLMSMATSEQLSLQCEAAELPGYTLNTIENKIFGAPTPLAGTPSFGDVSFTFICAGDLWEKKFFDGWLNYIIPKQTYLVNYKMNYVTDIVIRQYSEFMPMNPQDNLREESIGNATNGIPPELVSQTQSLDDPTARKPHVSYACTLLNAFPVTVNSLNLNWGADEIHRLTVAFKFDRWLPLQTNSLSDVSPVQSPPNLGDNQRTSQSQGSLINTPAGPIRTRPANGAVDSLLKSQPVTGGGGRFAGGGASGRW